MELHAVLFNELTKRGVSVYAFSKQTGIPKERIYKWRDGKGKPKADDVVIIQKWLSEEVTTLNEPQTVQEKPVQYGQGKMTDHQKYVSLLERTNESLMQSIQLSLNAILEGQNDLRSGHQVLQKLALVGLDETAEIRATVQKKDLRGVRAEVNKKIAGDLRAVPHDK